MSDHHGGGFRHLRSLPEARALLRRRVAPHGRVETVATAAAAGRRAAEAVTAARDVPGEDRAAMDGYAVVAADTYEASERAPATLDRGDPGGTGGAGLAVPVDTGNRLPAGADAVVRVERTAERDGRVAVEASVAPGENVAAAGEDVQEGERLVEAGRALAPSDLAVLTGAGRREVAVAERPRVSVVPTGDELVTDDPGPGETVETNALLVARLVERWGGTATSRPVVPDEVDALAAAIDRDADYDLVVTTGGSSVGDRDLLPDVVAARGEMVVHGVAIKPGHPLGFGVVAGTPVLVLPGYPVSCLVGAVQFLRPALAWLAGADPEPLPASTATLRGSVHSDPGTTQFVRVARVDGDGDGEAGHSGAGAFDDDGDAGGADGDPSVAPVRAAGAGVLSSVTAADGWVSVPPETEVLADGATVRVERWE